MRCFTWLRLVRDWARGVYVGSVWLVMSVVSSGWSVGLEGGRDQAALGGDGVGLGGKVQASDGQVALGGQLARRGGQVPGVGVAHADLAGGLSEPAGLGAAHLAAARLDRLAG